MGGISAALIYSSLCQWAKEELAKGSRSKASRIQKVADKHMLKFCPWGKSLLAIRNVEGV